MKSRNLGLGLVVLASQFVPAGRNRFGSRGPLQHRIRPARASSTRCPRSSPRVRTSTGSNQEATVADVIQVACDPNVYGTGSKIKITASQLFTRCKGNVTWYVPNPFSETVQTREASR